MSKKGLHYNRDLAGSFSCSFLDVICHFFFQCYRILVEQVLHWFGVLAGFH